MNSFFGIIIGAASFMIIGVCHPLVIWAEYKWTKRCWWVWLIGGLILSAASIATRPLVPSIILGVGAFSLFWGILELFEQENRVLRGNFPMNPIHLDYYVRQKALKGLKSNRRI